MRVITGIARGRTLTAVPGMDVRPTAEKVKEAVFSSIQFEVEGARVLDLFCGSGQMGIEALSRGAGLCVFVDQARASIEVTRRNLAVTGLAGASRVIQSDAQSFLRGAALRSTREKFDIAFLDPPYSQGIVQEILPLLPPLMNDAGVILCEHEEKDLLADAVGEFRRVRKYRYGRISISAYRKDVIQAE